MFKKMVLLLIVLSFQSLVAQITLTNNIGTLIKTNMLPCERDESWSRVFNLGEYGIEPMNNFN
jgi:hypothetical protein